MTVAELIHTPRLWSSSHANRRVTWMELFFDLIFVAAVAEVGKALSADFTLAGLSRYAFLFVLIWWAWSGHTLFSTRFDTDDLLQRFLVLLQCFIAAVMAANAKDALDSRSSAGFGAAYGGIRLILVIQYMRARRVPETRRLATRFAAGFGLAAVIWIASALTGAPERYWLWAIALAIDFATPWLAERHGKHAPPHAEHYPERFGLFTIILLGEFVAQVMAGIESQEYWTAPAASTAFMSMAIAFTLWWCYFDAAKGAAERHVHTRRQGVLFQVWNYAHLPLFLGLGVASIGIKRLIALPDDDHMHPAESLILFSAAATVLAALTVVAATRTAKISKYIWLQLALVVLLAVFGNYAAPATKVALAIALLASCLTQGYLTKLAARSRVQHQE